MPLGAVIQTQLHGPVNQTYGLYIDSLNVRPFTPLDSIWIREAGPGAVSEMTFRIEDPTGVIPLPAAGALVTHRQLVLDAPLFLGYVNDYEVRVQGIGRTITVNAIGIEALLDWIVLPGTTLLDAFGAAITDINPQVTTKYLSYLAGDYAQASDQRTNLIAPTVILATPTNGNADYPIGDLDDGIGPPNFGGVGATTATAPLRAVLETLLKSSWYGSAWTQEPWLNAVVTVDFSRRLRVFLQGGQPDDYTNLAIDDTVAGPLRSEDIVYEVHPGDVPRSVYVIGGNAPGSGFVSDGSGVFGRQAIVSFPGSTTTARRNQIASLYLASQKLLVRGTLTISDWTPPNATVHPGSTITITDAQVSLAAQSYQISEIRKSFTGSGRQTWEIDFGGRRPSFVDAMRRDYSTDKDFTTMALSKVKG